MDIVLLQNILSAGAALIIFGYKMGLVERKIENLIVSTQINFNEKINHLDDYIDSLKTDITILKQQINKDDEISSLRMSRSEYEIRQEIKFINLQIKAIIKTLDDNNCKVKIIDKDTLQK